MSEKPENPDETRISSPVGNLDPEVCDSLISVEGIIKEGERGRQEYLESEMGKKSVQEYIGLTKSDSFAISMADCILENPDLIRNFFERTDYENAPNQLLSNKKALINFIKKLQEIGFENQHKKNIFIRFIDLLMNDEGACRVRFQVNGRETNLVYKPNSLCDSPFTYDDEHAQRIANEKEKAALQREINLQSSLELGERLSAMTGEKFLEETLK